MENDKLIRLSHAISAAKTGADDWDGGSNIERNRYIEKAFADLPAVDAVEVVRCRDCVHIEPFRPHDGFCKIDGMLRENDFFCKYGQRRQEAAE